MSIMNTSSKRVSFSESSLLILTNRLHRSEKPMLWNSREEIYASKIRWSKEIKQVQSIDMTLANQVDASDFMGMERYLSKQIQEQAEENRKSYIQSVVKAQNQYPNHHDFASFCRSRTEDVVARSHAVGLFYLNRQFQQEQSKKCKSKFQETKDTSIEVCKAGYKRHSSDPTGRMMVGASHKLNGFKRSDRRNSTTARCA